MTGAIMVFTGLLLEDSSFSAAEALNNPNSHGLPTAFTAEDPTVLVGTRAQWPTLQKT